MNNKYAWAITLLLMRISMHASAFDQENAGTQGSNIAAEFLNSTLGKSILYTLYAFLISSGIFFLISLAYKTMLKINKEDRQGGDDGESRQKIFFEAGAKALGICVLAFGTPFLINLLVNRFQ